MRGKPSCNCRNLVELTSRCVDPSPSDANKDWTCKDKDQAYKDQDKNFITYCKLRLNLQSLSSNNNEHKVKVHNI